MKTIITAVWAAFLLWLNVSHGLTAAVIVGLAGIFLIITEGRWHFRPRA